MCATWLEEYTHRRHLKSLRVAIGGGGGSTKSAECAWSSDRPTRPRMGRIIVHDEPYDIGVPTGSTVNVKREIFRATNAQKKPRT